MYKSGFLFTDICTAIVVTKVMAGPLEPGHQLVSMSQCIEYVLILQM